MPEAAKKPERAWYDTDPYDQAFSRAVLEKFRAHQDVLKRSKLYERMKRAWALFYHRDRNADCDNTDIQFGGERGEIIILKPARFRRLINDQVDVVRQTLPNYEPVALNTDAESQAQTQLVLSILEDSGRRHHRPEQRVASAEMAALLGESVLHGRWDPNKGRVLATGGKDKDGKALPSVYEGDHVWSVRSPYEVAYDKTSPDIYAPRWHVVLEPENRFDLMVEHQDEPEVWAALRDAPEWSRHFTGEHMFAREEDPNDDSIGVYHVYVEPCPSCPEGRNTRVLDERTILTDNALDEKRAGVFILNPARVMFKREGHTNNFGGMALADAHAANIGTIVSNADAHGLQRLLAARKANLSDTDKGAGLSWIYYDHRTPDGEEIPEPHMLNVNTFPQELLSLDQLLAKEIDTAMGGSPVQRGDNSATQGESGSSKALLYAAAQSVQSAFMAQVLMIDAARASWEIESLQRHATIERATAIVGKKNEYTIAKWKGEDLSAIDRVNVRPADAARDSFAGRMTVAEMLIKLPPEERRDMQAFIQTGNISTITEEIDTKRLLIERENDAIRSKTDPMPIVLASDPHREHIEKHLLLDADEMVRKDPELQMRNRKHLLEHVAYLTPGSPVFDPQILMLTGQMPFGIDPNATPNTAAEPEGDESAPPVQGGDAKKPPSGMPEPAQQPKNPATGERVPLPGPPTPTTGGPSAT